MLLAALCLCLPMTGCRDADPTAADGTVAAEGAEIGAEESDGEEAVTAPSQDHEPSGPAAAEPSESGPAPEPDLADMESQVAERLRETRAAVLSRPGSAAAWGRFAMVAHAHELWQEALAAYRRAERLDRSDERWPYFLADVLSVIGTDLEGSERAFRRALELRPGYAPAHMRLGRVLLADGRPEEAARELERALELDEELEPAEVSLAQIELARGQLDRSENRLLEVLAESPRHAQALSTLGQVYMRQGRRDEAREVAARARDAAIYNLFDDPLMGQVVQEGISSVLIQERANAFFEDGNFEQAALGLEQVLRVKPGNVEVRHLLAISYGNLGRLEKARNHLVRVVEESPEMVDGRVQLGKLELELGRPASAVPRLRR
ncbi:MAG: tetratricopeptide repeat protein, partial [Holophagales bacterium]|nr:tetratricopeptide repeat protein [Holophagales bacterium]